jgi:glycogen operon protein
VFRARRFPHGQNEIAPGVLDIDWLDERGARISPADWDNQSARALVMALAGDGSVQSELVCLMMNASDTPLDFNLTSGFRWHLLIDSASPETMPQEIGSKTYRLADRAAAIVITTPGSRKDQPR